MNDQIKYLQSRVAAGKLSRRAFLGKAGALGVSALAANTMLAEAVRAAGPVKGGMIRIGGSGGESSNTLDPALVASEVPLQVLRLWGDTLVQVSPGGEVEPRIAESFESSPDAKIWRFDIRQGVEFHDGKTLTPEDVKKTIERHSNEDATSGALGIVKGIQNMKIDGNTLEIELENANADFPKIDEGNWKCFVNCTYDGNSGSWEMMKRPIHTVI